MKPDGIVLLSSIIATQNGTRYTRRKNCPTTGKISNQFGNILVVLGKSGMIFYIVTIAASLGALISKNIVRIYHRLIVN
jgi:hypothetical protein